MYIRCPAWALSLILIYVLQLQQRHSVFSEKAPLNTFQSDTDSGDPQNKGLSRFFGSVDRDGDGQIQPSEALSYIGANFDEGEINGNEREAAGWVYENLEGTDADATISKAEVERHLRRLLKGNRVSEWLKHAAQMPQYVQAFKDNQVTNVRRLSNACSDFLLQRQEVTLIQTFNPGQTFEHELGIKSKLHQEQLTRALKRVILGIGTTPSPPQEFTCQALSCHEISLSWRTPEHLGNPPIHKYKLERMMVQGVSNMGTVPKWETANPDLDDEDSAWLDSNLQAGVFRYRLTAWNAVGWSEYAFTPECNTTEPNLPCEKHQFPISYPGMSLLPSKMSFKAWINYSAGMTVLLGCLIALVYRCSPFFTQGPLQSKDTSSISHASPLRDADHYATAKVNSIPPSIEHIAENPLKDLPETSAQTGSLDEFKPDIKAPMKTTKRPSTRLAEADCFAPGQLDSWRALSSTQRNFVGGNGEDDGGFSTMTQGNVTWLDDEGREVHPPQGLEMSLVPEGGDRHKCAFPGCQKNLRVIFAPKAAMTSHYCSQCQNVFCHHHTRHSPHGKLGSCGLESKCICQICYDELPRLTQDRLEKTNKIHRSRKDADGNRMKRDRSKRSLSDKVGSVSGGSSNSLSVMGKTGEEHWAKLRTAWKAVKRFQGAGSERRRRTSEGLNSEDINRQ